jgi:hypothetical protein
MNGEQEGHRKHERGTGFKIFNFCMIVGGAYVMFLWIKDIIGTGSFLNFWLG